ncbi:hypothetical protein LMTR3_21705 [Bradyrhizobium sp. LMTR 3]|nr:hypothetical protein LMTR3_21705 [Bradyrhizobium sp. LMTR 3]
MLATWRAKPRPSVHRKAQYARRSGGRVAQDIAGFVVMVVALRFSMKETNSPSLVLVLVSKALAHAQILLECGSQSLCTSPGHGRLNVRSLWISTFA